MNEVMSIAKVMDVRCGVCRGRSIERRGDNRADFLGLLEVANLERIRWQPVEREGNQGPWSKRANDFRLEFAEGRAGFDPGDRLKARCRYGHEPRITRERLLNLCESADGVLYLPGS